MSYKIKLNLEHQNLKFKTFEISDERFRFSLFLRTSGFKTSVVAEVSFTRSIISIPNVYNIEEGL